MSNFLGSLLKLIFSCLLFVAIAISSAFLSPYFFAEHYEGKGTPHGQFRVLVEVIGDADKQTNLQVVTWGEYSEKKNEYKAYRSPSEGRCNSLLWCRAKNISPGKQLIELRYHQENFFLYNKYYVTNEEIIPLYFRIMDPGNAMLGIFISLIMTPFLVLSFGFFWKRFKKLRDMSNRGEEPHLTSQPTSNV